MASRLTRPGDSPEVGAVTSKLADRDPPGGTVPSDAGPDGEIVQPDGADSETDAAVSGLSVGLASVVFTENVPSASADDGIAASVGWGVAGGP